MPFRAIVKPFSVVFVAQWMEGGGRELRFHHAWNKVMVEHQYNYHLYVIMPCG